MLILWMTIAASESQGSPGFISLDKEPFVFQVPEFGDRFWVFALYDARTDEFSEIGKAYGTKASGACTLVEWATIRQRR